jgi:hypothetical protein
LATANFGPTQVTIRHENAEQAFLTLTKLLRRRQNVRISSKSPGILCRYNAYPQRENVKRSRPAGALFHAEEAAALRCSVDFHITAKSSRILSRHHVYILTRRSRNVFTPMLYSTQRRRWYYEMRLFSCDQAFSRIVSDFVPT